jgi:hypothetical protein
MQPVERPTVSRDQDDLELLAAEADSMKLFLQHEELCNEEKPARQSVVNEESGRLSAIQSVKVSSKESAKQVKQAPSPSDPGKAVGNALRPNSSRTKLEQI